MDKRLVDVVDQIRATVTLAIIIIPVDVIYQLVDRSIDILHCTQIGSTDLVEVSRTSPLRAWACILVKSLAENRVESVLPGKRINWEVAPALRMAVTAVCTVTLHFFMSTVL